MHSSVLSGFTSKALNIVNLFILRVYSTQVAREQLTSAPWCHLEVAKCQLWDTLKGERTQES